MPLNHCDYLYNKKNRKKIRIGTYDQSKQDYPRNVLC